MDEERTTCIDVPTDEIDECEIGVVANCELLNVRKEPDKDSSVVGIIGNGIEVIIDMKTSTDEFYHVLVQPDIVGYCMKKFINLVS